jgi:UDP-N-acetylmuramoyl-tripeptide--D-alanyl-D-alanine ligase
MSSIATVLVFAALAVLLIQRMRTLLTYFQQEEYDGSRYVRLWTRVQLFDVRATLAAISALAAAVAGANQTLALTILAIAFLVIAYFERTHRYKKPLVMTERATRLYRLALAAALALAFLVFLHPLFSVAVLQSAPLALVGANLLLTPVQEQINAQFEHEASAKLERLNPVRIGVTGSFGKTTVKHMLAEILEASGPVYFSRGSINTVLGHTRHIRQRLQWGHKYFVAEMGAYGIGSIKRLCDLIRPDYGIVTAVGDAHTERFGSLQAIAIAKSELATEVCAKGGTIVLNANLLQYQPFQQIRDQYRQQVVTVGPAGADVEISSTPLEGGSWTITLRSADPRIGEIVYDLPLLGEHNVMNSALAVTLAAIIDQSIAGQIPYFTRTLAQVPHRLQKVGSPGSALILDDAYNSNESGFISAVSAMNKLAAERGGRRILVTPGIAELGLEHTRVHSRLGTFCGENCDVIYVVNPDRIASFVSTAMQGEAEVIKCQTFAAARLKVDAELAKNDVVLYENDLPDTLEERRLL